MDKRKLISRNDLIIISIVVICAICFYLIYALRTNNTGTHAEIRMNGNVILTVSLEENKIFSVEEHPAVQFIVRDGRIAFYASDCPDQICVRNGFLHLAGQASVCLPNRIVLNIVSPADDEGGMDLFID